MKHEFVADSGGGKPLKATSLRNPGGWRRPLATPATRPGKSTQTAIEPAQIADSFVLRFQFDGNDFKAVVTYVFRQM